MTFKKTSYYTTVSKAIDLVIGEKPEINSYNLIE